MKPLGWQLCAMYGCFLGGFGLAREESGWWIAVVFALLMLARSRLKSENC